MIFSVYPLTECIEKGIIMIKIIIYLFWGLKLDTEIYPNTIVFYLMK